MLTHSKRLLFAIFALFVASASGCSSPADLSSEASNPEIIGRTSAADTAVWTSAYVGDAHAGSVWRSRNITAKAALVMASDGTNLSLVLYFCGEGDTLSADTKWLKGRVPLPRSGNISDLGGVTLTTPDGWSAYVNMSGPGTVTRDDGVTFQWVASYVGDGTSAGLYRYVYSDGVDTSGSSLAGAIVGLIQWNGGSQGAVIYAGAHVMQVMPYDPADPSAPVVTFAGAPAPVTLAAVDPIGLTATR
jgi:hypothetical protein